MIFVINILDKFADDDVRLAILLSRANDRVPLSRFVTAVMQRSSIHVGSNDHAEDPPKRFGATIPLPRTFVLGQASTWKLRAGRVEQWET